MDITLLLSLIVLGLLAFLVRRWIGRAEERGFVQGWDACARAERARVQEPTPPLERALNDWLANVNTQARDEA
jgi:hypothetical protein